MRRAIAAALIITAVATSGIGCADRGLPDYDQVFVVDRDGSGRRQLTSDNFTTHFAWSPNERWIAAGTSAGSSVFPGLIKIAAVDSSQLKTIRVPSMPSGLSWSPDGKRLLFVMKSGVRGGSSGSWIGSVGVDGRSPKRSPLGMRVRDGDWAPDGRTLVFGARFRAEVPFASPPRPAEGAPFASLWAVEADGHGLRQLLRLTEQDQISHPSFSPDGKRIAYIRARRGQRSIWSVSPDGTNLRRLSPNFADVYLNWAPDSQQLAVVGERAGGGPYGLYVLPATGGRLRQLIGGDTGPLPPVSPAWSPDSKWIAVESPFIGQITLVSPVGREEQKLTYLPGGELSGQIEWSPDGSKLAFTAFKIPRD